jgi:hypothetical protein
MKADRQDERKAGENRRGKRWKSSNQRRKLEKR